MKNLVKNVGILACLALLFLFVSQVFAPWVYNPFTRKLDYYSMDVGGAIVGEAAGDILYHDGTNWTNLTAGANGLVLALNAGLPTWVAAGAPGAHAATHELLGADLVDHDNLTNFVQAEHLLVGAIDHDSLLNFVAGEHLAVGAIDHDSLLNFVAGEHLAVGAIDHDALLNFVAGEHLAVGAIDHDSLLNYVAGEHLGLPNTIANVLSDWDADLDTYAGITPSANVQTLLANATFAAFMADLSGTATAAFDWGGQNLTNVGSIAPTSIDCGGVITAASYIAIEDSNELRFYDNGNYVGFEPGALEANQIWVLPIADGANTQVMQTNGAGTLTWVNNASGSMATDDLWAAQGDLAYGNADDVGMILSFNYDGDFLRLNATLPYWDGPGIANTNPVVIDHAEVADDEYARFTASGLESRSAAEVLSDISAQASNAVLTELTALTDPAADKFPFWNDTTNNFEYSAVIVPTATGVSVGAAGNAGKLELEDADGDVLGIQVGVQAGNTTYTWPTAHGGAGEFLQTNGAGGVLSWAAAAGGGTLTTIKENDAGVGDADIIILDFLGADFVVAEAPDTEIQVSLDYPNAQKATTAQAGFLTELATTAEVSAGVDTTRAVTADALAGSDMGRKSMVWKLTANDEVIVDQDDYDSILVPADFAEWLITGVAARIVTADDGADFLDIGIYNVTQTAEILSTLMRIEATEFSTLTSAQPGVIDAGEDDITAADVIRIDVDYAGDNCTGLEVHITFEKVT